MAFKTYYAKVNGTVMPTPFTNREDAHAELDRLDKIMTVYHREIVSSDEINKMSYEERTGGNITDTGLFKLGKIIIYLIAASWIISAFNN